MKLIKVALLQMTGCGHDRAASLAKGLRHLLGAHCTVIEAAYQLRQLVRLDRRTCVMSAVGSSFALDKGIDPLNLAR